MGRLRNCRSQGVLHYDVFLQYFFALTPPLEIQEKIAEAFPGPGVEPHITVKAQGGLRVDTKNLWLPRITHLARRTEAIEIELGPMRTFGESVLYISVRSVGLKKFHDELVRVVGVTAAEAATYYEGKEWVPHLTLRQGVGLQVDDFEDEARMLTSVPRFSCRSLILFSGDGDIYHRESELFLRGADT
jgi:2'-5' RNA ligase